MSSFASKVDVFPDFQPTARKVTCHEPASTRRPTKIRSAPRSVDDNRGEGGSSFGGEQAALRAYYGAKIEATRRSRPRDLAAALRTALGKDPEIETRVDPAILGGVKVRVGSRLYDASLKSKLDSLKFALKRA